MKNDHRQEQKLFYICSPPPNFNVELGWVPNQVVMKNDHLRWTPFCFTSNFEIGGAGVVTSSHASNPRWSFFMTNPGKENCQTNKNPGLKPLIISQHALRIPLQLGSLSCSFFKPLINAYCRNDLVHNQRPLQLVIPWVALQERRYNTY